MIRELTGHLVVVISHNQRVPIKELLETFCLHQVNFKVTVYIFIMKVIRELTGHLGVVSLCNNFCLLKRCFCVHYVNFSYFKLRLSSLSRTLDIKSDIIQEMY